MGIYRLSLNDPSHGHKSAPWKVVLAAKLKHTTDAPNPWLAQQLNMGSAAYVSKHIGLAQRQPTPEVAQWLDRLSKVKGEA